jgi:glycosyltransferase involved in cell wall biosynthesis
MERIFVDKMNCMAERGHQVYLITYEQVHRPMPFPLLPKVTHVDLGISLWHAYAYNLLIRFFVKWNMKFTLRKRFAERIREIQPDIITSTAFTSLMPWIVVTIQCKAKKIFETHLPWKRIGVGCGVSFDNPAIKIRNLFDKTLMYKYMRKGDALVALTYGDAKCYPSGMPVDVIPNLTTHYPIELPSSIKKKSKSIIAAGRIVYQKGYDLLIQSWITVNQKHPDWRLHLYGTGEDESILREYIKRYRLGISFVIHPPTNEIMEKYMESDFFVLSSRFEGFGLVLVEAMACGIPCVSFDCPYGPADIIKDGEDGLLIENGNVEQLAEKICWMIEHEEERLKMGRKARENVRRYLPEHIIPQWEKLFLSLM